MPFIWNPSSVPLALVLLFASVCSVQGAIIVQGPVSQNNPFTVSSTDLLETSVASTNDNLTINTGENNAAGGSTSAVLSNGNFGFGTDTFPDLNVRPGARGEGIVIAFGQITYNFDTSVNTQGYDITGIDSFSGWADLNRGTNFFSVQISTIGNAAFINLVDVPYIKDNSGTQDMVSIIENTTGVLATNVDAIRFDFGDGSNPAVATPATNPTRQEFSGNNYKEIDVFGVASVPEPSSLVLLIPGMAYAALRRRKRKLSAGNVCND